MAAVACATFVVGILAIDARATYGAQVTADEPQYLTTALSLAEDFDLDISDELESRAFLPYHEIALDPQTIDLDGDGQRISPHDPLLPALLAVPMGLGGWQLAKATLALMAAVTAAITAGFTIHRLGVTPTIAGLIVGGFFVSPPMTAYATQVYPEMPAALCVVAATWALMSPRARSTDAIVVMSTIALPWLAVKYVPVAAVLALALVVQDPRRRRVVLLAGTWAIAGALYLLVHRRIYGGWTVYASGDHFVDGEFSVVGNDPNYVGRSRRLIGLLVDRGFGLIAWTPAFVLALPAMASLAGRRTPGWRLMTSVVLVGWAMATWVALTMHGWWWPGRQLVVILPVMIAAIAVFVQSSRAAVALAVTGCAIGSITWLWLVLEASTDRRTLIVDFQETSNPWYRVWRTVLPDHMRMNGVDVALTAVWTVGLLTAARKAKMSATARRNASNRPAAERDAHPDGAEVTWQRS